MVSTESTSLPLNPRHRVSWLAMAHVVVGLMGASSLAGRSPTLPVAAFIGLVFSQTSLLGIWGSLGTGQWWRRMIGVVVGAAYLSLLLEFATFESILDMALIVVLTTTVVAIPLLIVRFFRVAVQLDSLPIVSARRLQFSIRDLMILTFVVAFVTAIGKWAEPHLSHGRILIDLLLFGVTFGVVGTLPVWFVLATKRSVLYSVGLIAVGACAGCYLARIGFVGGEGFWTTVTSTEALVVVVSLLVVRSCGYRLVRLPPHPGRES